MSKKFNRVLLVGILVLVAWLVFKEVPNLSNGFQSADKVIVIDAGHGGKDPGTIGFSGQYEKEMNLAISKKLMKKLKKEGYKVYLTRDNDEYVDNMLRAKLANDKKARVFVSIHGNAVENNDTANGVQVLYFPSRKSSIGNVSNDKLAQTMMRTITKATGASDRGIVEREDLIVLNQTKMPAIIVEAGFLTNEAEEKRLFTDAYQNKVVDGIVEGLKAYFSMQNSR
ncbi:N-acetylmuramoyl-L-alanine amidase [Paenibacillus yanchengensis]|uniref:N-acetylmuramoyl-L-alanine amidase n=1 Tax=Paenibacillus yanchengensis TaxID=2035833 RepID=A0ABW4YEW0_9BACL